MNQLSLNRRRTSEHAQLALDQNDRSLAKQYVLSDQQNLRWLAATSVLVAASILGTLAALIVSEGDRQPSAGLLAVLAAAVGVVGSAIPFVVERMRRSTYAEAAAFLERWNDIERSLRSIDEYVDIERLPSIDAYNDLEPSLRLADEYTATAPIGEILKDARYAHLSQDQRNLLLTLQSRRNELIHGARPPGHGVLRDWLKIADELQADLFRSDEDYTATLAARDEAALREAAAQGDQRAMYVWALHLLAKDQSDAHAEAEHWLRRAAIRGNTGASIQLAFLLLDRDDPSSTEDALQWLRRAALHGDIDGMISLGMQLQESDSDQAEYWFRRAAEQGSPTAMRELAATLKLHADHNAEAESAEWIRKADEAE
jgi:hypothetical protein